MLYINTSTHPSGGPTSLSTAYISYGDGQTEYGIGDSTNHIYNLVGDYTAVLHTVFYADSTTNVITCSDSAVLPVVVGTPGNAITPTATYIGNNTYNFYFSLPTGVSNLNPLVTWHFGDGNGIIAGAEDGATHQYCDSGIHTITFATFDYNYFWPANTGCTRRYNYHWRQYFHGLYSAKRIPARQYFRKSATVRQHHQYAE